MAKRYEIVVRYTVETDDELELVKHYLTKETVGIDVSSEMWSEPFADQYVEFIYVDAEVIEDV